MKKFAFMLSITMILGFTSLSNATLWDRGGGLIYDDVLKITWLQDANYAKTSDYDADGRMNWSEATTWAANLVYGGYDDWRLPKTVDEFSTAPSYDGSTSRGYNSTSSEMGYMYYTNLANKGYFDTGGNLPIPQVGYSYFPKATFTDGNGNSMSIQNLQADAYRSGTEWSYNLYNAWSFYFHTGEQTTSPKDYTFYAWAVRDGDVTDIQSVPEPATILLLGLGLMGLVGGSRKLKV